MRSVLRAALRGLAYAAYVALVCIALLEGLLRLGVMATPLHHERQAIRERLTDRPRVLILGDSFSIEGPDSVGTLRRANSRELYLEQDTHLNADGNRIAFEQIRDNLVPPTRQAARD